MRQYRRYLPWVLPSILTLLAPAAWVVSHAVPSSLNTAHGDPHDGIFEMRFQRYACNYGEIAFEYAHISNPDRPQLRQDFAERYPPGPTIKRENSFYPRTGFMGFSLTWIANPGRKVFSLFIPIWLFVLLGSIPLLRRLARIWVARERARTTLCPACGYDLRSSSGRCPECGAAPGEVAIAHDSAPAVIAVARSSGTKCVALMAAYMSAAVFVCLMAGPMRHFFRR